MWANCGKFGSQGLIDQDLPGGIGNMIVPPDDMGNGHGDVIHHHCEVIGGDAIGPHDDQVVQFGVVKGDGAFGQVVPVSDSL